MKPEDYQKLVEINTWQDFTQKPAGMGLAFGSPSDYLQSDKLYVGDDELSTPNLYGESRTTPTRFWEIVGTDDSKYYCTALTISEAKQKFIKVGSLITIKAIREIKQLDYEVAREEQDGFAPRKFLDKLGIAE